MRDPETHARRFLLLQGPHGPFFDQLGAALRARGHAVARVGFNRGDEAFWSDRAGYIAHEGPPEDWPEAFRALVAARGITDIALYGDTRPVHAGAIAVARAAGLTVHVFEEGYLRPYWVTYERDGSNGHSRLARIPIARMRAALPGPEEGAPEAPAHWGDMRQHMFYGALYHFFVMFRNGRYRHFRPHRGIGVAREFRLHLRRFLMMPLHRLERALATWRIRRGGFAYHLVLLQLEHDASFRAHGPFASMTEFLGLCIAAFARAADAAEHLVFKAHPLEDGRTDLRRQIARLARAEGVAGRVHFVRGGKLAFLLDGARSAITVNSTAAQQALWRGLPLKSFGRSVYDKPELVCGQRLEAFLADPRPPDPAAYRDYRRFLLATSQVPGGYYSARGRRRLLRRVPELMLADADPYAALLGE